MEKTNYPGIFVRVKAASIDSIIVILLIATTTDLFSQFEKIPDYAKMIAFAFIFILYEPLMVSFLGSTAGHKISNIRIQKLDNGKKINFGQAFIRFLVKVTLGWASFFTVSTNKNKQAIHDSIVNSVVVYDN
ncbi:conserved hypothetical protein [Tenacibaculum sediminilitoris]|uniref:RDD family protein n=1 Tax=Tenacibaculum sediminilitoris TaxID=1820334 RepID=UPI003893376C